MVDSQSTGAPSIGRPSTHGRPRGRTAPSAHRTRPDAPPSRDPRSPLEKLLGYKPRKEVEDPPGWPSEVRRERPLTVEEKAALQNLRQRRLRACTDWMDYKEADRETYDAGNGEL